MNIKRFTLLLYVFSFFQRFGPIWAVEKLFMQSRGFTLVNITWLVILWLIASFLLEIPTGIISDRSNRKYIIFWGQIFITAYFAIILFVQTPQIYFLSLLLLAFGTALISGTLESYVYDYLQNQRVEQKFHKIWGRSRSFTSIGNAVAVGVGGFITTHSYNLAIVYSIAALTFTVFLTILLPSLNHKQPQKGESHLQSFHEGLMIVVKNPLLLQIALYAMLVLSVFTALDEYLDIYLKSISLSNTLIGFTSAAIGVVTAFSFWLNHRIAVKRSSFIVLAFIVFSLFIILALFPSLLLAMIIIPFSGLLNTGSVLCDTAIQQEVTSSNRRATTASVIYALQQFSIFTVLAFGYVANHYAPSLGIWVLITSLGMFLIGSYLLFLKVPIRYNPKGVGSLPIIK